MTTISRAENFRRVKTITALVMLNFLMLLFSFALIGDNMAFCVVKAESNPQNINNSDESSVSNERIKVIPGTQGTIDATKTFGGYVNYIENKDYGIKPGDTIIDINGVPTIDNPDINYIVEQQQTSEKDEIIITYIRDDEFYEVSIPKGVKLGVTTHRDNWIGNGYISMIDPSTSRYAGTAYCELTLYRPNPYSGFIIEAWYDYNSVEQKLTHTSNGEVIGSITNLGKAIYGYMESASYDEKNLVEIAFKDEVEDGKAVIILKTYSEFGERTNDLSSDYYRNPYFNEFNVNLKCEDDEILLNIDDIYIEDYNFQGINIPGAPIFQNGRLVGVYCGKKDNANGKAWYAIDVYNEMMETAK